MRPGDSHRFEVATLRKRSLNAKALIVFDIFARPPDNFPARHQCSPSGIRGIDSFRVCIGVEEILTTFEFEPAGKSAFAGTVGSGKDRQERRWLRSTSAEFAEYLVISISRRTRYVADFKFSAARLLHHFDARRGVAVENRDAGVLAA